MASESKKKEMKEVAAELKKYSTIGILDMHRLPARQLLNIRNKLRGKAVIKMVKKRLIAFALKESKMAGLEGIAPFLQGEPALLLSNEEPFRLARLITDSRSKAAAKPGNKAPSDIVIRAGITSIAAGPAIGDFQRLKIPAMVEAGKIAVRKDTVVAKEGDEISKDVAAMLGKLGIEPMEVGLNLVTLWEKGLIYDRDLLLKPVSAYVADITSCHSRAFGLSVSICYVTKGNVEFLVAKGHREALGVAKTANILTSETVKPLIAKADAQAEAVKGMMKGDAAQAAHLNRGKA